MRYIPSVVSVLLFCFFNSTAPANATAIDIPSSPESSPYPISVDVSSSVSQGTRFITVNTSIAESEFDEQSTEINQLDSNLFSWSYPRSQGSFPSACPVGYDPVAGLCAEICPEGYTAAVGGCWQNCPQGYTDLGAICAQAFNFLTKQVLSQGLQPLSCPEGQVNELGLCYDPCAEGFVGVGPMCFGDFNTLATATAIDQQVAQQQAAALDVTSSGINVNSLELPLQISAAFTPVICGINEAAEQLGFIDLEQLINNEINPDIDGINQLISDSLQDALTQTLGENSFIPIVANTVLFDFSAEFECEISETQSTATLSMLPSVTVELDSRMFDTALHAMAGVDLGIVNASVYELIPFRLYGTVGATVSADTQLQSTVDFSLADLTDLALASNTKLDFEPAVNVWLSSSAYLRVTSLFSFLPDILELGADFDLNVVNASLPYTLELGFRPVSDGSGLELFQEELLLGKVSSGDGSVDTFLRIFGEETGVFDEGDTEWEGVLEEETLKSSRTVTPLSI